MVASTPSSAAALPEALTAQILQHVPQQQRLQQCALTCKAWASAAALATVHVELKHPLGQPTSAFDSWLQKYAEQVEGLKLSHSSRYLALQLPLGKLAKLQQLELEGFMLQLPGEAGSSCSAGQDTPTPAPLLLPSLQYLELSGVHFFSSSSLLQLAAGAPGLTSLKLKDVSFERDGLFNLCNGDSRHNKQMKAALRKLLQQLPGLSVLELRGMPMSNAAMQQLGCMHGLLQVALEQAAHLPTYDLQHLPSSITQLHYKGDKDIDHSLPPQLPQLAGLLQLNLQQCAFTPTVLGTFARLQALKLRHCTLLPCDDVKTDGTTALLDELAKMTCLQDLELSLEGLGTVSTAPQCFAGLTASTHLTRLKLEPDDWEIPLAKGAVQYMFSAGRQLPLLQQITISRRGKEPQEWDADDWCLDCGDIGCIASCCTGLQRLDVALTVKPGADLSALLELPRSCTSLLVGGVAFTDAAAPVLVQLTHLEYLSLNDSPGFTDVGLEQLLALDLKGLDLFDCELSHVDSDGDQSLELSWNSQQGSVRQQLEELCDRSPVCAPARLKRLREAIEQLQSDNKQLQTENATLRLQLQRSQGQTQGEQQLEGGPMSDPRG